MDTNKNGTVSREEYSQFLGRRDPTGRGFGYLDANHNGKLENNALRRIYGPGWVESIGVNHPPKR
jgi:EF hand domain-containing protein